LAFFLGLPFERGHDPLVGASLLAMVVNDNAGELDKRGALESIACNRASTGCSYSFPGMREEPSLAP